MNSVYIYVYVCVYIYIYIYIQNSKLYIYMYIERLFWIVFFQERSGFFWQRKSRCELELPCWSWAGVPSITSLSGPWLSPWARGAAPHRLYFPGFYCHQVSLGWPKDRWDDGKEGKKGFLLPSAGTGLKASLHCRRLLQPEGTSTFLLDLSVLQDLCNKLSAPESNIPILSFWLNFAWSKFHKVGSNVRPFLRKESWW